MRSRILAAALSLTVLAAPALAVAGSAQTAAEPTAKVKAGKFRMLLTYDFKETLKPGTRVRDASHHKNGGVVVVQSAGKLRAVKGIKKRGVDYPNRCSGCGRALIEVRDRKGLDPGTRRFTFGTSMRVAKPQAASGSNIVQKGYFHQAGGQFSFQLNPGGIPACVFYGSVSRMKVTSSVGVANNRWHRVNCLRGSAGVSIWVDGKLRGQLTGDPGSISNAAPLRIGAKKTNAPNKQFRGVLDNTYLRFLP